MSIGVKRNTGMLQCRAPGYGSLHDKMITARICYFFFFLIFFFSKSDACAAASLATGTLKGEHET